jgi:energy-coupling factor transport system ATP-binding protein
VTPPVVDLGRLAGWTPLPLSVRDARRAATGLRQRLTGVTPRRAPGGASLPDAPADGVALATVEGAVVRRGGLPVLRGVDLELRGGTVTALMGRNGAGKSTLLAALAGQVRLAGGRVHLAGDVRPDTTSPDRLVRTVGLVPQDPTVLLYAETVGQECTAADGDFGVPAGTARALLERLAPGVDDATHPRDLSEGQRLALALAVVLAASPSVLLLDEPTRGLDYGSKARLVGHLRDLAAAGHAVLMATHDVELAAEVADEVLVLADGEVVAAGGAASVLAASPAFAPQVAKVMHPAPWLTVGDLEAALETAS